MPGDRASSDSDSDHLTQCPQYLPQENVLVENLDQRTGATYLVHPTLVHYSSIKPNKEIPTAPSEEISQEINHYNFLGDEKILNNPEFQDNPKPLDDPQILLWEVQQLSSMQ